MVSSVNVDQPTLALNEFIPLSGVFPEHSDGSVADGTTDEGYLPLGVIRTVAGFYVPGGADAPAGQTISVQSNTALFTILGIAFGGNGTQNFALPNLAGREAIGAGQGVGLENTILGEQQGSDTIILSRSNLPPISIPVAVAQPSTTVQYLIDSAGGLRASNSLDFAGEVVEWAGTFIPEGFLAANGQALNIADYPTLFQAIGTTYGGNGVTTFDLPNLQGRTIVGAAVSGAVSSGNGRVTLTKAQMPVAYGGQGAAVAVGTPTVGMEYLIATAGLYPSQNSGGSDGSIPYIGEIVAYAGVGPIPTGWALANGQTVSISSNQALFSLLGTTYGGNGTSNFDLPNLIGRSVVGTSSSLNVGQTYGASSVTLTTAQVPGPSISPIASKNVPAGTATLISSALTLTSATGAFADAKVSISSGFLAGDVLSATTANTTITTSYNSSTGVLTLSGTDTVADYQKVLDSVAFTAVPATNASYPSAYSAITFMVDDGGLTTSTSTGFSTSGGAFADTAANVSARFDALNGNTSYTSITITDGQPLTITQAQYTNDTRALGLIGASAHSLNETGITGQAYTSRLLTYDTSGRVSTSTLHDSSNNVVGSSSFSYGTGSAYTVTIQVTGTDYSQQIVSYDTTGALASSEYDGYTDKAYTSLKTSYSGGVLHDKLLSGFTSGPYASMDIAYDSSGRNSTVTTYDGSGHTLTTASYSYGTGGAYTVTTNFTSGPYTSQAVTYTASGQITSNDFYGYTGQAYSHIHFDYSNGAATVETFFNNDGSHLVQALTTGVALNDTAVNEAFYLTTGDTFTLSSPSFGQDTIRHYTPGSDTFDIYTGFGDFNQFIAAAHDDGHGDTLVTYDVNDTLLFVGVTIAQLQVHQSDFNFFSS